MSEKPKTFPFGPVERDLCDLARMRVAEAIHSVLQLADTKQTKWLITLYAMNQAVAMCGGAYSAVYVGQKVEPDEYFDLAKAVLDIAKEARR